MACADFVSGLRSWRDLLGMTDQAKKQLRLAKKRIAAARCTCPGRHDPFWVQCERTLAQIDVDNALEAFGVYR